MKKRSDYRNVEHYGDCDTDSGQRIPQGRGFFQLRHETMLHASPGALGHSMDPSDSRTADRSSLRVNGLGSTFLTPSRRAASADPARPRRKRPDRTRMGAAYTDRSDSMNGCAPRGIDTLAITRRGTSPPVGGSAQFSRSPATTA